MAWDAETLGGWAREIDGADVVINLAGRSVNCRYNAENRREIMDSRVDSTRVVGEAIAAAARPPRVWLQASTATIYAHRYDAAERRGDRHHRRRRSRTRRTRGGSASTSPRAWERALDEAPTPRTRKVLLRSAMIMSPDRGGMFDTLLGLVRRGLGGTAGDGRQYVSWIHHEDFVRAVRWLIEREDIDGAGERRRAESAAQRGVHARAARGVGHRRSACRRRSGCWRSARCSCGPRPSWS